MILPGDGFQSCPSSWCSSPHWRASYPTRGRRGPCCALQSDDKLQKLNAERNAPGKRESRAPTHTALRRKLMKSAQISGVLALLGLFPT